MKQKDLLEKKRCTEVDAAKQSQIDLQVKKVETELNSFAYQMGVAKYHIYTLHQLHPIYAEAFYKMLEPKLDEMLSLMAQRSEQRLKNGI